MILTGHLGWKTWKGTGMSSNPRPYERRPDVQPSIKVKRTGKSAKLRRQDRQAIETLSAFARRPSHDEEFSQFSCILKVLLV